MNKQKIKGVWNEAVGETKEHIGRAVGNKDLEQKGHDQEMQGKRQKAMADAEEAFTGFVKKD